MARVVTATGTYDADDTVVVRYRTRDGASGHRRGGAAGHRPTAPRCWSTAAGSPPTTSGTTPATCRRRRPGEVDRRPAGCALDATGDSAAVTDRSTRADLQRSEIGPALGPRGVRRLRRPATRRTRRRPSRWQRRELPELDNGPHFFYGLQWWFFGLLAIFGFFYLLYDEWRGGRGAARGARAAERRQAAGPPEAATGRRPSADSTGQSARSMPPSTGSMAPVTNDAAGESRKAAARPNSSGSP